ncbi:MAG: hypothetical protein AABY15_00815, partial [Nanoarchaeota archaeon]
PPINQPSSNPSSSPGSNPDVSTGSLEECLFDRSETRLRQIGLQGGYIETPSGTYINYNGENISIQCYNLDGTDSCRNRVWIASDMENELEEFIEGDISAYCSEDANVSVDISDDVTTVASTINGLTTTLNVFVPLGRLYEVAHDIKNAEALNGEFDTLDYALTYTQITGKPYVIQRLQPYPDELYILKIQDTPPGNEYIFQFFIEGEN